MAITKKTIHDITGSNLYQVPASRGGNPIQWIVIHYLGVANADNPYLYGGGYGGHYNITRDGTIYKAANPRTAVVWHCGGSLQGSGGHQYHGICTNYNSIGIENGVCQDAGGWYFTTETQESLVYLVSTLMDEYGIDINHVIRHFDVTGKCCPEPYVNNHRHNTSWTWDQFKQKLAAYRSGKVTQAVSGVGAATEAWKATGTAICAEDGVNIRKKPAGEKVGQLNCGNRFEIDGKTDGDWTHIKVAGVGVCWMYTQYVLQDKAWKATGTATCRADRVNVRSTPSQANDDNIFGILNTGQRFELDGKKSGDWIHVKVAGMPAPGWMHKNWVKYDG